jgi:hypothetical protein
MGRNVIIKTNRAELDLQLTRCQIHSEAGEEIKLSACLRSPLLAGMGFPTAVLVERKSAIEFAKAILAELQADPPPVRVSGSGTGDL